ncbi:MAG: bifunctional demethylmenaquinone methyltransferase/2-methoxy-6-polyprenyl-1,4-benzoquinol methylase UbiE [Alphaproteobacteria bacterium]|nr:bifunctional demethylmenaquinone methyltransferase/2-methoxy-6-polyprenyl-1,4-benzoquinol methylase UbiE [Alphaproteobacteria bacterium]
MCWFTEVADVTCRQPVGTGTDTVCHAKKVDQMFGAIARRYDLLNDIQSLGLHRLWKRRVVALSNFREGEIGLDLCCGTGDLAIGLAKRGGSLVGMDMNRPMLQQAASRLAKRGEYRVSLAQADALKLPVSDNSLDLVTISYGLRNLVDLEDGLREVTRVLKPGGRLLILDFGKPANRVNRSVYFLYLAVMLPMFGWLCCGNASAYAYILKSLKKYTAQKGVAAVLRDMGYNSVQVIEIMAGAMSIHIAIK